WGFEKDHTEMSFALGERALFPKVRQATGHVIADGYSCRTQIEQGTGTTATHIAKIILDILRYNGVAESPPMQQVLLGFTVFFLVIGVGVILGRTGALCKGAQRPLGLFVYYVATPELLFDKVTEADPAEIFSANFVVIALSALIVGVLFFLLMRFILHRDTADSIVGMLASSYANAGNL